MYKLEGESRRYVIIAETLSNSDMQALRILFINKIRYITRTKGIGGNFIVCVPIHQVPD